MDVERIVVRTMYRGEVGIPVNGKIFSIVWLSDDGIFFSDTLCFRKEILWKYSQDGVFIPFLKNWKEWIHNINIVEVYISNFQCVTLEQKDIFAGGGNK